MLDERKCSAACPLVLLNWFNELTGYGPSHRTPGSGSAAFRGYSPYFFAFAAVFAAGFALAGVLAAAFFAVAATVAANAVFFAVAALRAARVLLLFATVLWLLLCPLRRLAFFVVMLFD